MKREALVGARSSPFLVQAVSTAGGRHEGKPLHSMNQWKNLWSNISDEILRRIENVSATVWRLRRDPSLHAPCCQRRGGFSSCARPGSRSLVEARSLETPRCWTNGAALTSRTLRQRQRGMASGSTRLQSTGHSSGSLGEWASIRPGWAAVRRRERLSDSASAAVKEAMLTLDIFPSSSSDGNLPPVLAARTTGDWSLRQRSSATSDDTGRKKNQGGDEIEVGDRFVQRVLPAPWPGLRWLAVLSLDEVAAVFRKNSAVGFTVLKTEVHEEIGQHTALIRWGTLAPFFAYFFTVGTECQCV